MEEKRSERKATQKGRSVAYPQPRAGCKLCSQRRTPGIANFVVAANHPEMNSAFVHARGCVRAIAVGA